MAEFWRAQGRRRESIGAFYRAAQDENPLRAGLMLEQARARGG